MGKGHSHRPTVKKDHKGFKSRHATKGQLKAANKGKVQKANGSGSNGKSKPLSKIERKNHAKQLKENKILESKLIRKLFEGSHGAEKIVSIIPLTNDLSATGIANALLNSIKDSPDELDFQIQAPSVTNVKITKFRSNLKLIIPDATDLLAILDAAKVSDFVIFGISATQEVDPNYGEQILRAVIAQGIASVLGVLPNLISAYPKRNLQLDIRQSLTSYFNHFFPSEEKLYALENETECVNAIRTICQKFPKSVHWRDSRSYLVADSIYASEEPGSDLMVVEGTVRGIGFDSNHLIHIPGKGDFQIDHMEKISKINNLKEMDMDMGDIIYPNETQETLEELNPQEVDMEEYEDWDGLEDDEYNEQLGIRMDGKNYFNDDRTSQPVRKFKLPKGTSEYQSKWLLDEVLEGASDVESADEDEDINEAGMIDDEHYDNSDNEEDSGDEMQDESMPNATEDEMFVDLSPEEEMKQLEAYRSNAKEDLEFPDEIELHPQDSAKKALKKYRGIKSLANCDWDYDEYDDEAPKEWTRLLRLGNYKAIRNKIHKEAIKNSQINVGNKVKIYVRASAATLQLPDPTVKPTVIYGLLEHEHKLAVVNFSFENWEDFEESIPSKQPIIAQYGPRRQIIRPLFNQASINPNNVHKLERFHHNGNTSVATCIAPVLFSNAPTIFFKELPDGGLQLVGQGTFLNCDHTRVVAERSILTGHPVKIHKRVVTVRYMFFNPEDINWFKAVPLYTPLGRTGFIKESLGTHGYYKATFDGKLSAQDVVAMNLYKRTWPETSAMYQH